MQLAIDKYQEYVSLPGYQVAENLIFVSGFTTGKQKDKGKFVN